MNNAKLDKYRAEKASCMEKIAALQDRVRTLNRKIEESENMEIRALMKDEKISMDELLALVRDMQAKRDAKPVPEPAPAPEAPKPYGYWEETAE